MGMFSTAKRSPILGGGMDSIIGENARLKGELISKGSVNVAGEFEGAVRADGEVIISTSGKVVGELHGGTVSVSGRVDGNIFAKETLEVCKTGRVHGDLSGGRIIIEEGATYHGRVKVESGEPEQPPPQTV
jgi:cytoskeletal protein CcmA (bactofilin family)